VTKCLWWAVLGSNQ